MKKFFALLAALLLALAPGLGSPALSETELSYEALRPSFPGRVK